MSLKQSRQAVSISSALSNRSVTSRRNAFWKKGSSASRRPGSNASGLMVISVPGGRCEGSVVPSPHCGSVPGGQLVERHGGGVALGVQVPARRLAQRQERIEVAGGPGADVLGRRAGEGEVEEHDVQLVAAADHADRDVVRLDVAVRDALFLQVVDHVQQVFAEALQEVDVQPAFLAPPLAEGLDELLVLVGEDRPHEEPDAVADLDVIGELDDVRVAELLEHVGLVLEPGVVLRVAGHLEHVFLALPLHEQDDRAGPLADAADDLVAAGDQLAGLGLGRVVDVVVVGGGQLVLDVVQLAQEIDDRAGAV